MVKPRLLDRLLTCRKLAGFKRRDGWVTIGIDPIRGQGRQRSEAHLAGRERRSGLF